MADTLLEIKDLVVHYETESSVVEAVNNVSLSIRRGETLGLVGETGAGKTTLALGIMRLIPNPPGHVIQGEISMNGENLMRKSTAQMRRIRGKRISMIFQDPMTSLNPIMAVGDQIQEVIRLHERLSPADAVKRAIDILELVGIPGERYGEFPHQFSGGMRQRVVIAIALACSPELLIADEPTTALDVTIQAQILDLMRKLKEEIGTSMLMITHDLGVVAETCDRVAIMYAGEIIESGTREHIFRNPRHPYTVGLFNSLPSLDKDVDRLEPIHGLMPDPMNLPAHCSFSARCKHSMPVCEMGESPMIEVESGHFVRCRLFEKDAEVDQ